MSRDENSRNNHQRMMGSPLYLFLFLPGFLLAQIIHDQLCTFQPVQYDSASCLGLKSFLGHLRRRRRDGQSRRIPAARSGVHYADHMHVRRQIL